MTSIFDIDFLEQTFGLPMETLDADVQDNEGVFGLDEFQYENFKTPLAEPLQDSIDDLLQPSLSSDPLAEDWMEMVDLSNFLEDADPSLSLPQAQPISSDTVETIPVVSEEENTSPFEYLKSLLLSGEKLLSCSTSNPPKSPEPQVAPQMPLLQEALLRIDALNAAKSVSVSEVTVSVEPTISLVQSDNGVAVQEPVNLIDNVQVIASPLSTDDLESLLSSPSSPSDNKVTFHTVDTSCFTDSSGYSSDKDTDWLPDKSEKSKSRSTPYSSRNPPSTKRERKKEQNKNAATRYRVKKRHEKANLNEEENKLSTINKELKDKVDSLQREISYMKDLMNEIYKAKGVKS